VSPIVGPPPPDNTAARDLRLGRIRLPTLSDDVKEALGSEVETVGAAVSLGDRRARALPVSVPVHGDQGDTDSRLVADRMRRQVRALADNARARGEALYLAVDADPDLNGWLIVGSAELEHAEGGVVLGDYRLSLSDTYRIGGLRTHRPARMVQITDRRIATTPRDVLRRLYSTDFSAQAAQARTFLPVGATDVSGSLGAPLAPTALAAIDGSLALLTDRTDLEVLSFEQGEADHGKADVLALDRRGIAAPAFTLAGDADPQGQYGWEELYGPDQHLSDGDVPTLQNGLCRTRFIDATDAVALDAYVAGTGFVEQARVTLWRELSGTRTQFTTLGKCRVVEWTPERSVVAATLSIGTADRCEVYLTLQRGWKGPRVEAYAISSNGTKPGVEIRIQPATAGDTTLGRSSGTDAIADTTDYGNFSALAPYAYLLPQSPNLGIYIAVCRTAVKLRGTTDSTAYGAARTGIGVWGPDGTAAAEGYASAEIALDTQTGASTIATDHGKACLYDARAVPVLVQR
jgi:hypothetical protein